VMDTGGFKGRSKEISRKILYRKIQQALGVHDDFLINEYGMTEMGSQFYDTALKDHFRGIQRRSFKARVPWVRTQVIDPLSLKEVTRPFKRGLLRHFDLSNRGSVMGIQTEDVGYLVGEGFEIEGRASGADLRGCSLDFEELLR